MPEYNRWIPCRSSPKDSLKTFDTIATANAEWARYYLKYAFETKDRALLAFNYKQTQLEEKDELLQDKDRLSRAKKEIIAVFRAQYLQTKGLKTARGIVENFIRECSLGLQDPVQYKKYFCQNTHQS